MLLSLMALLYCYDIMNVEEDSNYTVTVTASNAADSSVTSNTTTAMTLESGENSCIDHIIK